MGGSRRAAALGAGVWGSGVGGGSVPPPLRMAVTGVSSAVSSGRVPELRSEDLVLVVFAHTQLRFPVGSTTSDWSDGGLSGGVVAAPVGV